jgi:hypothetical protein
VREELLAQCRAEQIEPPSAGRCDRPDDTVRAVVYPVASEKTLRDLVAEYKSSGTA